MTSSGEFESNATRRRVLSMTALGLAGAVGVAATQEGQDGGQQVAEPFRLGGEVPGWQGQAPQSIQGQTNPTLSLQAGQRYEMTWENLDGQPHNFAFLDDQGNQLPVILPEAAGAADGAAAGNATDGNATSGNATGGNASSGIRIQPGADSLEDVIIGGPRQDNGTGNATGQAGNMTEQAGQAGNQTDVGGVQVPQGAISVTEQVSEEGATQSFQFVATPNMATYICPIHPTTMEGDVQVAEEGTGDVRTPSA